MFTLKSQHFLTYTVSLVNWVKIAELKTRQFKFSACMSMTLSIQIAKFKCRQYQLRAVSPNLMFTKITCYTVYGLNPMDN